MNIPLLKYVAKTKKNIILSTGMCNLEEIKESVNAILKYNKKLSHLLFFPDDFPDPTN